MTNSKQRRRQRKNNGRKHDQNLQQKSNSAQAKGIANTPAAPGVVKSCPLLQKLTTPPMPGHIAQKTQYEFCNLNSLTVKIERADEKVHTVILDKQRRAEPVRATAKHYAGDLTSYDLVAEVLSLAPDVAHVAGKETYIHERRPLQLTVTAKNGPHHTSFTPAHPHTCLYDGMKREDTDGGKPVEGPVPLGEIGWFSPGTWGRLWPFGAGDERHVVAFGQACGNVHSGKSCANLYILMPVFPHEEWSIALGMGAALSGSREVEHKPDEDEGGEKVKKTTVSKKSGFTTHSTETKEFQDGHAEREVSKTRGAGGIAVKSSSTLEREAGHQKFKPKEDEKGFEIGDVTVEWKVAGEEHELEGAETVEKIIRHFKQISHILKEIAKIFDSIKFGWSYKLEYSILKGDLKLAWGHKWPDDYVELDRVYYIQRYVRIGGECTLLEGKIEGMFGVEVENYFLPSVICKVALELTLTLKLGGYAEKHWTNARPAPGKVSGGHSWLLPLDGSASLEPKLWGEGAVSWLGVGARVKAGFEGKQEITLEGGVTLDKGLEATTSFSSDPIEAYLRFEYPWGDGAYEMRTPLTDHYDGWKDRKLL